MIAPVWPNQPWFPQLLNSLNGVPILLPQSPEIVTNPLGQNHLGGSPAWPVSGDQAKQENFLNELSTLSDNLGDPQQKHHTPMHGDNGITSVLKGIPSFCASILIQGNNTIKISNFVDA